MRILFALVILSILTFVNSQTAASQFDGAYILPQMPSYVILAPKQIRPDQMYQASVTIIKLLYSSLTIRMTIKKSEYEYAHTTVLFKSEGTQIMRVDVPSRAQPGTDYFLDVIGSVTENSAIIFSNRTKLMYNPQEYSVFIQMSKPVYHQSQTVQFRVIPVRQNLMPKFGTVSQIRVKDPNGFIIKRWLSPTTNVGGIYELQFPLADQVTEGTWKIEFDAEKWVANQTFEVREYWLPRFDVNITIPVRLSEHGFGVFGMVQANKTSGMPVSGNGSITIQIHEPSLHNHNALHNLSSQCPIFTTTPLLEITRKISYFDATADFLFTMDELKGKLKQATLANKDVWVCSTIFDRLTLLVRSGWAYSFIYSDMTKIKLFGGPVRPYKPGMPFTAYIAVYQPDGTPVYNINNRNVEIEVRCNSNDIKYQQKGLTMPETGILKHTLMMTMTSADCGALEMRAIYVEQGRGEISTTTQRLFEYQSLSKAYMQLTMATDRPRVNEFAVFHVQMSYPTDRIYYQIIAAGNIVYTDTIIIDKTVNTRTFSVAVSREMAPIARILAYYVKSDGEIVSDSLTFFVNITNLNNVHVSINRGKDLNVDTLEINGYAEPGSFLALNVLHYDLYRHGANNILRDYNVMDEMLNYEKGTQLPYQQNWMFDLEYQERSYVPAPSAGADTNTTMDNAGVILFTDAAFLKVNFNHDCNETRDPSQAFPCYNPKGKQCYSRAERCDGSGQCATWADEAGCEVNDIKPGEKAKDMMKHFNLLYRHWNDGAWLWKTYWVKPNGRINFRVDLPKMDTSWVVGAFAIDRRKGFSIIERPALFSGLRRFYMVVEAPELCYYGEQIGVRVTLFNYWDYWTEALLEVKRSNEYRVVQVKDYGRIMAYNADTITNQAIQTLVYLTAGEARYIFIPVIPNGPGNATIHLCAYTFIGSNCESLKFRVKMNGVPNYHHTAKLIDLTAKSKLEVFDFKIELRQNFYEPEERMLRFVPDSKLAKITISGDTFGPTPSEKMEFFDVYEGLRMSHGALENIFFEFGFNIQLLKYLRRDPYANFKFTKRTLDYCNRILQDCLSYYDKDSGGFSNFREQINKPNVLATAFAIWNLNSVRSGLSEWDRLIYVPIDLIDKATNFLTSKQSKSGNFIGSFEAIDILDNKFYPTNISSSLSDDEKEAQKRIPVAAMVIIALSDFGGPGVTDIVNAATLFIQNNILKTWDIFTQIIGTYALVQAGQSGNEVSTMLTLIQSRAIKLGETYIFSNTHILDQQQDFDNAARLLVYPRIELPNDGYTVACSSLGMLLMNRRGIWKENDLNNNNMIQFLARMRNHVNGFASTFDSLVAVRALNQFAETDRNRQWYKLLIKQGITSDASWEKNFYIDKQNYSVGNTTIITNDHVWGQLTVEVKGTGRVLLQMDVTSRVFNYPRVKNPKDPVTRDPGYDSYNIYCIPHFSGKNSSIMHMEVCGNWIGTKGVLGKPNASMTVFEVDIPTGFVSLNDDLQRYVKSNKVSNLRYARFWPGTAHFYFDYLAATNTCITFRADRYFPVANVSRDHLCNVFEYYEPGRWNRSIYTTEGLYSNHVCNVFGSYQCPYSPFFNAACHLSASTNTVVMVTALVLIMSSLDWVGLLSFLFKPIFGRPLTMSTVRP